MNEQEITMARLEKLGFNFSNWITAQPDADGNPIGSGLSAVMVKLRRAPITGRHWHEYREVGPDGSTN